MMYPVYQKLKHFAFLEFFSLPAYHFNLHFISLPSIFPYDSVSLFNQYIIAWLNIDSYRVMLIYLADRIYIDTKKSKPLRPVVYKFMFLMPKFGK